MAYLDSFSTDEKELLIALPYRVGVWMSDLDDTGDDTSDTIEMQALEQIIGKHAQGMFETALIHEILSVTFTRMGEWESWDKNLDHVLDECGKALAALEGKVSEKDIHAFKKILMQIALGVARSYREFDQDVSFMERMTTTLRLTIDAIIGRIKGESYMSEELLNISLEEDVGLSQLAKALSWKA